MWLKKYMRNSGSTTRTKPLQPKGKKNHYVPVLSTTQFDGWLASNLVTVIAIKYMVAFVIVVHEP